MSEFKPSPAHLKRLFEHTHQALRLYYNKQKWPAIYPTLSQLAERFVQSYHHLPNALHAHLQFYASDHGYATNLTVNQCILVCAFCSANGYDEDFTEELVIAALSDHLCCSNETNKAARGEALSAQETKLVKLRHQFAITMLDTANVPQGQLQRILSRLDKYTSAITGNKSIPLYDNTSILVTLAKRIAKAITPRPKIKTFTIVQALKSLYLGTYNEFAQLSLSALARQITIYPGGSLVNYKGQQALVLCATHDGFLLVLLDNNNAVGMIKTSKRFIPHYRPISTSDRKLLFSIWFNEQIPKPIRTHQNHDAIWQAISNLGQQQFLEFKAIEKTIKPFSQITYALQQAARQYNRQGQKASTVRHCLTMVGLDTAGLLCQRVLLETLISQLRHPFAGDIWHKYNYLNKLIMTLLSNEHSEQFEHFLSPFTAAIYFILAKHSCAIRRLVKGSTEELNDKSISIAHLFGFDRLDEIHFSEFTNRYFANSPSHQAFLETEKAEKSTLSNTARTLVVIKLLATYTLGETQALSAWQTQLLNDVLKEFQWLSLEQFCDAFIAHGPSCSID
ncbi:MULTISPECIES: hypothetical protein [Pseudoalteromonas]|uniref:Uncharacterized protein n=1 Tax=Pseudoalteromonas amylolytica TaxID=1859457 RepID=A0A1S1MVZ4_9GAMM|nr:MULTISPECIES: hypothetical protein [Pseudoalteromonas]OHU85427.1 hypothetical protein BFC16_18935 [Pseudoalteromonas sp. JW3]OHU92952.1 hypothetical protein BET10_02780 [Pseudoalteromonas amylolytica]